MVASKEVGLEANTEKRKWKGVLMALELKAGQNDNLQTKMTTYRQVVNRYKI